MIRHTLLMSRAVLALSAATLLNGCIPALVVGGASGAAYVAHDRRTSDTILADERIEFQAGSRIRNELVEGIDIDVRSVNRMVLLTGQTASAAKRSQAAQVAASVEGVRRVYNELVVSNPMLESSVPADALLSTQVKARLVGNAVVNPLHVRVTAAHGTVYLMGLVTAAEAAEAVRVTAVTRDVKRVVRLFEIVAAPALPAAGSESGSAASPPAN